MFCGRSNGGGLNRTNQPPEPSKNHRMQTIKGLIALLLVAVAIFAIAGLNDIKSQDRYAVKLRNAATAYVVKSGNQTAARTATNVVNQARHKIKNENL
jgi:type IV secretory pathway component VirB8